MNSVPTYKEQSSKELNDEKRQLIEELGLICAEIQEVFKQEIYDLVGSPNKQRGRKSHIRDIAVFLYGASESIKENFVTEMEITRYADKLKKLIRKIDRSHEIHEEKKKDAMRNKLEEVISILEKTAEIASIQNPQHVFFG